MHVCVMRVCMCMCMYMHAHTFEVFVFVCFGHFLEDSTGLLVMTLMILNSDLLILNMQNSVLKVKFIISAAI